MSDAERYQSMLASLPRERVDSFAAWLICLAAQHYGAARNSSEPAAALLAINVTEPLFIRMVNETEARALWAGWKWKP